MSVDSAEKVPTSKAGGGFMETGIMLGEDIQNLTW